MTLELDRLVTGTHERNFARLPKGESFKDLSTVIITPIRGQRTETGCKDCPSCGESVEYEKTVATGFHPLVVQSWKSMVRPMNQPITEITVSGYEVGDAYTQAIQQVLDHPVLGKWKYVLFMEDDVIVPTMTNTRGPLWALYRHLADGFAVASGLYYTKGDWNMPLVFGDVDLGTDNFEAVTEFAPDSVVECNGTGMGFTLMKLELFRDERIEKPWFKTLEEVGVGQMTQDLWFYRNIRRLGYRVCVDTSVKCGHVDVSTGEVY